MYTLIATLLLGQITVTEQTTTTTYTAPQVQTQYFVVSQTTTPTLITGTPTLITGTPTLITGTPVFTGTTLIGGTPMLYGDPFGVQLLGSPYVGPAMGVVGPQSLRVKYRYRGRW